MGRTLTVVFGACVVLSSLVSLWPALRPALLGVSGLVAGLLVAAAFVSGLADSLAGAI